MTYASFYSDAQLYGRGQRIPRLEVGRPDYRDSMALGEISTNRF